MTGTVLVADDHPLFRQALRLAVERILPEAAIAEAGTLATAVAAATAAPDLRLILLDLKMPGATGYSGIALLHAECPDVPILVVSSAEGAAATNRSRPEQGSPRPGRLRFLASAGAPRGLRSE